MKKYLLFYLFIFFLIPVFGLAQIKLPPIFNSGMVLPRNQIIPLSGTATPKTYITVEIDNQKHRIKSNKYGDWKVELNPLTVGGPYKLAVESENGEKLILDDILSGDIWLCAGQSNMQYTLNMLQYKETPDDQYNQTNIRLCSVWVDRDYIPKTNLIYAAWNTVNRETARNFSAVGYFFARFLSENSDVPVGIISSNLGATAIETWMSMDAVKQFPSFDEVTNSVQKVNKSFEELNSNLVEYRKKWDRDYYLKGPGMENKWYDSNYDYSEWAECELPAFWDDFGFEDHDGSMWFKRSFDADSTQLLNDFNINLNQIDDYDRVWVNGVFIGETFGNSNFRNYVVPKEVLKPKDNVITIRVFDIGGKGGIYTNAFWGNPILNGIWKYRKGITINPKKFPIPQVANGSPFSHPMLLYNGSIAPLHKLPITGVIWYQGESNVSRAVEYEKLLTALIKDWRSKWNNPDLPFFIVQLANYKKEDEVPADSQWAELRESQFKVSGLKNVDLITAIDIGEANDIHPYNKKEIGRRLSYLEEHYIDGLPLKKGPVFLKSSVHENAVIIEFETYGSSLKSLNKYGYLEGFTLAGSDGVFHWAKAKILDSTRIKVYHDTIEAPVYVRYAWSDNPGSLNLVNEDGLPAFPFRTDSIELSTQNNSYKFDPNAF